MSTSGESGIGRAALCICVMVATIYFDDKNILFFLLIAIFFR